MHVPVAALASEEPEIAVIVENRREKTTKVGTEALALRMKVALLPANPISLTFEPGP